MSLEGEVPQVEALPQDDDGFDTERVALVIEHFVSRYGGACELHKLASVCTSLRNLLSGRRLLPFVQRFPSRFSITSSGDGGQTVRCLRQVVGDPPEHIKQYLTFAQSDHYNGELLVGMEKGIVLYTERQKTTSAPLRWLYAHRAVPKLLKGWAGTHPVAEFQYHRQEGFGGHDSEQSAKTASLLRHLRHFVDLNPEVFRWEDETDGRVALTEGARAVLQRVALDTPQHPDKKRRLMSKRGEDTDVSLGTVTDLQDVVGAHLLVTRVSTRTKDLNKLELRLLAQWAGLESLPAELRSGLLCLSAGEDKAVLTRFIDNLTRLTSVRRCCTVLCASDEPLDNCPNFIAAVEKEFSSHPEECAYRVEFDTHFPEAKPTTLPFTDMTPQAMLLSRVFSAVGLQRLRMEESPTAPGVATLVLISVKGVLLLAKQLPLSSSEATLSHKVALFNKLWESRPFIFSGAMESVVGSTVVAVARLAYAVTCRDANPDVVSEPGVVLDACCGSSTLATAAAVQGTKQVFGFELRNDFVCRIAENLAHVGVNNVTVLCHDCTKPFVGAPSAPPLPQPDLVFCNAPWGKKFGTEEDCDKVIRGVLANYPATLVCFVVPKVVFETVRADTPLEVVASVPIGSIHVVLTRTAQS